MIFFVADGFGFFRWLGGAETSGRKKNEWSAGWLGLWLAGLACGWLAWFVAGWLGLL